MSTGMSLSEVLDWLPGGKPHGDISRAALRVHTDSRTVLPGDIFVALKGDSFDGNLFLNEAGNAGAVGAICNSEALLLDSSMPGGVVVSDTLNALQTIASRWRARFSLPVIAVTGSNGKTTVTQMIASILREAHGNDSLATIGNLNNHIGVPLTLLRLRSHHKAAVIELGMNHAGEMAQLADWTRPTVALVNNAQREHQEFMGTVEAVARENGEVLHRIGLHGTAVFPMDDPHAHIWCALAKPHARMAFSLKRVEGSDVWASELTWNGKAWRVRADTPAGVCTFELPMLGIHNVRNSLAAVACTLAAGVALPIIASALEKFEAVPGRSRLQRLTTSCGELLLVDDSYNANPDSVRSAMEALSELPGPHLIVLGDMGEVGVRGPEFHAEVGEIAVELGFDHLVTLGELSVHTTTKFNDASIGKTSKRAVHHANVDELIAAVRNVLPEVRSVLVKGSRFMRMERVVRAIEQSANQRGEPACS